jgi:uncharacterized membrane protein
MKLLYLLVFFFGLIVIFVLPLLHIISPRLVSVTQIFFALIVFIALVKLLTRKSKKEDIS